jgi:hypothetical protein
MKSTFHQIPFYVLEIIAFNLCVAKPNDSYFLPNLWDWFWQALFFPFQAVLSHLEIFLMKNYWFPPKFVEEMKGWLSWNFLWVDVYIHRISLYTRFPCANDNGQCLQHCYKKYSSSVYIDLPWLGSRSKSLTIGCKQ